MTYLLAYFHKGCPELPVPVRFDDPEDVTDQLLLPGKQPEPLASPFPFGMTKVLNELHSPVSLADEIFCLREEKEKADSSARSQEDLQKRITELQDFLKDQQTDITEFDERMVRKLIRQIIIY